MKLSKNNREELVTIADALEGEDYYCVDCSSKMIAKNKKKEDRKRDIHFAHYIPCTGNIETYLHKVAKQIIEDEKRILLPGLGEVKIKAASQEEPLQDIVHDILLIDDADRSVIVEIFVTHKTDEIKIEKMKGINIPAFEIDLSSLDYDSAYETIRYQVIDNLENKARLNPLIIKEDERKEKGTWFACIGAALLILFLWMAFWKKKKRRK